MKRHFYVASHGEAGALTHIVLSDSGELKSLHQYAAPSPDYLCSDENKLYALLREPFRDQSGVASYLIQQDGSLLAQGVPIPCRGSYASYVYYHHDQLYVTNYMQGTTIRLPDRMAVHVGGSIHPIRQQCSHPHMITAIPGSQCLCITDLGTDKLYVMDTELNVISETKMKAGSGPRHIVFSQDGSYGYCANELDSTVTLLEYADGRINCLQSCSTIPQDCHCENAPAAIRLEGSRLYVSNRGHDSICVYDISKNSLKPVGYIKSYGYSPRDILISDHFLLCANEGSNQIAVFVLGTQLPQTPVCVFSIHCPWCIHPIMLSSD